MGVQLEGAPLFAMQRSSSRPGQATGMTTGFSATQKRKSPGTYMPVASARGTWIAVDQQAAKCNEAQSAFGPQSGSWMARQPSAARQSFSERPLHWLSHQ